MISFTQREQARKRFAICADWKEMIINAFVLIYNNSLVCKSFVQPCEDLEAFEELKAHHHYGGIEMAVYDCKDFEGPELVYFAEPPLPPLLSVPERIL